MGAPKFRKVAGRNEKAELIRSEIDGLLALNSRANFLQSPLASEFFKRFQAEDDDFREGSHTDLTEFFYSYLFWKVKYKENINLSIYGLQRGGKSALAMKLAILVGKLTGVEFPADCSMVFKNPSVYLRTLPKLKDSSFAVVDEQKVSRTQLGSVAESWELEDVVHIIAKRNLHVAYVAPVLFPERDSEYGVKVLGIDRKLALVKALLFDLKNSEDGFFRMFGFFTVRHYDLSVSDISADDIVKLPDRGLTWEQRLRKSYEMKKNLWVEEIKTRMSGSRAAHRLMEAIKLGRDPLYQQAKNSTQRTAGARILLPEGYTEEELDEIVKMSVTPDYTFELLKRVCPEKDLNMFIKEMGVAAPAGRDKEDQKIISMDDPNRDDRRGKNLLNAGLRTAATPRRKKEDDDGRAKRGPCHGTGERKEIYSGTGPKPGHAPRGLI